MPPWLQILLLAAPMLLWAAGAAIRLHRRLSAPPRVLKAIWSSECAADLQAFHTMDAEKQLIEAMTREVRQGIEEEITNDLLDPPLTGREKFLKDIEDHKVMSKGDFLTKAEETARDIYGSTPESKERLLTATDKYLQRIKDRNP